MNPDVASKLSALESAIRRSNLPDELRVLALELRVAIQKSESVYELALAKRGQVTQREGVGLGSVGIRAVFERAWRADPKQTELDLIRAGRRDLAAELGDWWMAVEYRARQARLAAAGTRHPDTGIILPPSLAAAAAGPGGSVVVP